MRWENAMKFTMDVECTPEEARRFLGLPDVTPMQDAVMDELQKRMMDNINAMDAENLMKTWLPATIQGWTDLQKMVWSQMGQMPGFNMMDEDEPPKGKKKA